MSTNDGMEDSRQAWRHSALLGLLVLLLVVEPLVFGVETAPFWFDLVLSLVVLAVIASRFEDRRSRLFLFIFGSMTVLLSLGGHAVRLQFGYGVVLTGHLAAVLFLGGTAVLVILFLLRQERVTLDSLVAAVCGYLLLGMAWAMLHAMLECLWPGSFRVPEELMPLVADGGSHVQMFYYFSFVTLTTLGYGDITPISNAARVFTWTEAVAGQFYLAVVVAGMVGALVARRRGS